MPYVGGGRGYTFDRRYLYNTSSKEDRPVRQVSIADRTHVPNFSVVTVIPGRTRKEQEEERETQRTRDLFQATRLPLPYFFYQIPRPKSDQHKPPIHPIPPFASRGTMAARSFGRASDYSSHGRPMNALSSHVSSALSSSAALHSRSLSSNRSGTSQKREAEPPVALLVPDQSTSASAATTSY